MSVEISELQDSVRQVVEAGGLASDENSLWSQLVELGWLLVAIPEDLGGLESGLAGACAVHRELGRGLATVAYLPAMLVLDTLCAADFAEREQWLEQVITGQPVTTSLADCSVTLDHGQLRGSASALQSADQASHALIWTDDQQLLVLLALEQQGVTCIERPTWDQTRRLFDLQLDALKLEDQQVLAQGDQAQALIRRLLTVRDFSQAAEANGAADALLSMTVEYLQTRVQFRRPLAMFQALKHRCADLKAAIAAADALLQDALQRSDQQLDSGEAELKAKAARWLAAATFRRVAEEGLQLHGGIGMADEHPCHLFLKRALLTEQLGRGALGYAPDIASGFLAEA